MGRFLQKPVRPEDEVAAGTGSGTGPHLPPGIYREAGS
jgi:hypothetical protein